MKNKNINYQILFCLLLVGFYACKSSTNKEHSEKRIITDMAGRKVEIPEKITSIFIDRHSATLVYAFDTAITVNAVFKYNDTEKKYLKPCFYKNKPYVIEGGSDEEIVRLHPDVIFSSQFITKENVDKANQLQERVHIPVIFIDMKINRYKEAFTFVGKLLDKPEKAKELSEFVQRYIDSIPIKATKIPADKKQRVYYAEGIDGLKTDPTGSVHSLLLDSVGVVNVAQVEVLSGKGMTDVSLEQVYVWNPEIILVWSGNFDDMYSYKAIETNPIWKNLSAVKNHKVYQVPWKPFGWIDRPPGVNRIIGYIWLAHLMHPDIYPFDMVKITKEYFQKFFHYSMTDKEAIEILNPQPKIR
jgi:iron complex transport system substrate-binding protein